MKRYDETVSHEDHHGQEDKKKRFTWAGKHKEWTINQWKSVVWSDESRFEIFVFAFKLFCLVIEQQFPVSAEFAI